MRHSNQKTTDGFTLLEVMIAMVILLTGLLGAGAMQFSAIGWNAKASHITVATTMGLNQVENILSWDFSDTRFNDNENVTFARVGNATDTADNSTTTGIYTVYWDNTPRLDKDSSGNTILPNLTIGIDVNVYVVWTEGSNLKTIPMMITKSR